MKHPEKYTRPEHLRLLERLSNQLLLGIENRGKDATGFVAFTPEGSMTLDKNNVPAQEFVYSRKSLPSGTRTVLLHTRLSTQGDPKVWGNNHPVFYGDYFTVHNGTIYNDGSLFKKHELERIADVDSEIIPAMLNKYGLDKEKEAFAELAGGFATASVNMKVPNLTILAKGGNWPIVTLETKDLVIFASTEKAIKDAWGEVLGTPPSRGWETLGSGDIWYLNRHEVTKFKKAFEHQSYSRNTSNFKSMGAAFADDWDEWDDERIWPYTGDGNRQFLIDRSTHRSRPIAARTVLDNEQRMKELRATGKGACVTYGQKDTAEGKKYLDKYGNGHWAYCVHCKVSVSDTQIIKETKDWGNICVDCFAVAKTLMPEADGNIEEFLDKLGMRSDDFDTLLRFSDTQSYVHNQALYAVARETGIKRTMIDWILHRVEVTILEQNPMLTNLYCEISDRYVEKMAEYWQAWAVESDEKDEKVDPYVTCASGTHKQSEECEACKAVDEASGESCGVDVFEPAEKGEIVIYDSAGPSTCLLCRRKPTFFLGLTHAWCTRHKHKCSERGCKEVAVGYLEDNKRLCHGHSRGKKGYVADNDVNARRTKVAA